MKQNIVSLTKMNANAIIKEEPNEKNLKYEYKVNTNIIIGKLKNSLVIMLLEESTTFRLKFIEDLLMILCSSFSKK
ncbi:MULTISPECIES: hypothetical protein [unclassified Clostridium]|uniref:hypothetical protein n=1 Tax=unclassified Clostridium TaxID=2614128 RepID=UPI0025C0C18D|nr:MULTISPECIES: hypothetical protein [unclassified Clostridium]